MKSLRHLIYEAAEKPSDLRKYKNTERKEQVHFISGDVYDFSDSGYDDEFMYYSGEGNGYIKDKDGHVYDVFAHDNTGDAGRIAGGSHSYYVTIKKANGTDDFFVHGYSAVFSSSHNASCIDDIKAGYYLEDYVAKYFDGDEKFKELASKGDKNAKTYAQQKSERIEQKRQEFYERFVVLPETLYYEISDGEFKIINWRMSSKSIDKIKADLDKWIKLTGKPSYSDDVQNDPKYNEFKSSLADAQEKFDELMFSILKPVFSKRISEIFKTNDLSKLNGISGSFIYEKTYEHNKGNYGYKVVAVDTKKKTFVTLSTATNKVVDDNIELKLNDAITFTKKKASQQMLDLCKEVANAWKKTEGKKQTQYVQDHWEKIWQGGRGMYAWNSDKYTKGEAKQIAKEQFIKLVNDHDFDRNDRLVFSLELIKGYIQGDLNPEEEMVEKPLENPVPAKEKKSMKADKAAYDKMKAWHEGTRKQNLKNCSDEKLKMNYEICKELGYSNEMKLIEVEASNRGLEL